MWISLSTSSTSFVLLWDTLIDLWLWQTWKHQKCSSPKWADCPFQSSGGRWQTRRSTRSLSRSQRSSGPIRRPEWELCRVIFTPRRNSSPGPPTAWEWPPRTPWTKVTSPDPFAETLAPRKEPKRRCWNNKHTELSRTADRFVSITGVDYSELWIDWPVPQTLVQHSSLVEYHYPS